MASPKGPQGAARELMLESLYGCAEEALLRRVASPKCTCAAGIRFPDERSEEPCESKVARGCASPKGPQGAARELLCCWKEIDKFYE